ncbi:auxin-responsive protein IAA31-like [Primulina tabacum]|uniref:auxin-responsive protein IAA31-like n=1 Tax=Primulina tabacum TaxID=48773 RepID=UPI003F5A94B1
MELQLGLALSSSLAPGKFDFDLNQDYHETDDKKYRYDEPRKNMNKSFLRKRKIDLKGDDHFVIGWPPVKSRRQNCGGHPPANYVHVKNNACCSRGGGSNSLFVKVKMEGIGIGRKIDLKLYHSYQTLVPILIGMFGKCRADVDMYNLMYQDEQGGWLLAGDVPWRILVNSVRRLKLVKKIG